MKNFTFLEGVIIFCWWLASVVLVIVICILLTGETFYVYREASNSTIITESPCGGNYEEHTMPTMPGGDIERYLFLHNEASKRHTF